MNSNFLGKTGLKVSRLGLGTAEIGFAYGLGLPELPSELDALAILNRAVDLGVTFFDTANYYGLAEERIGKSGILKNPEVVVCTKCAQFLEKGEHFSQDETEKKIREQVEGSLRALGADVLPLLLLHGPSAEQIKEGFLISVIKKLQEEGKVRFWGASTRGEEAPLAIIESGGDALQVAFNIADRRMEKIFEEAEKNNVGIINRSIYLKGVFAGRDVFLPESLKPLADTVSRARKIADNLGITLTELALRYSLSEPAINTTLVGTAKIKNLEEAVSSISKGPLPKEVIVELQKLAIYEPEQVDPARWPKI